MQSSWPGIRSVVVLFAVVVVLAASASADELEQGVVIYTSGIPWDPAEFESNKLVYGNDDRHDIYTETDPVLLELSRSVCALMSSSALTNNGDGTYTIHHEAYIVNDNYPLCAREPFRNQPATAWCSGFVLGPQRIVTAGHCTPDPLYRIRVVFGYEMINADTPVTVINANQVYTPIEVLSGESSGDRDHSVVLLDRPITAPGVLPLAVRSVGTIADDALVGVIGHPSGLPKKIAFGVNTRVRDNGPTHYFFANLDTYGGNSGSPVFNQITGEVEGILVRGETDYVLDVDCYVSNVVDDANGKEVVTRTSVFSGVSSSTLVGTWDVDYEWKKSTQWFIQANGTFSSSAGPSGTWTLTDSSVALIDEDGTTYRGTLVSPTTMQGTMESRAGDTGTWYARRSAEGEDEDKLGAVFGCGIGSQDGPQSKGADLAIIVLTGALLLSIRRRKRSAVR